MSGAWERCVDEAGAVREDGRVAHFGDPQAEARAALDGDALFDLSHLGLVAARGADAASFLQGQLTSDVSKLAPGRSQLSAWLSPKGRVLVRMRLLRLGDAIHLELPRELLDSTLARLRMFVLRAKVTLDDASGELARMGIAGPTAARRLGERLGALPRRTDQVMSADGVTVVREHGERERYQILAEPSALAAIWRDLLGVAVPAGASAWELLDIAAGIASVASDTADQFLPQMLNLDRVGGVSFDKGCYVGQEIVARTHYLGRLKRRLFLGHTSTTGTAPRPGEALVADGGDSAGQIVNAQAAPEGGYRVLAVMSIDAARGAAAQPPKLPDGTVLVLDPLPYSLEDAPR